jgi:hypothetical protein
VYDDGSKHCFSCAYHVASPIHRLVEGILERGNEHKPVLGSKSILLPEDGRPILECSNKGIDWLSQYNLTVKEITGNLVLFSEKGIWLQKKQEQVAPLVIFPVYDGYQNLLLWTGRNLSYEGKGTKWALKGDKNKVIHGIFPDQGGFANTNSTCCVCEDIVSAIKLGSIIPTYPLFGKNISELLLRYLSSNYSNLLIYLDYDAIDTMMSLKKRYEPYFSSIRIIISYLDPKAYSREQLKEIIK